MDFSGTTEDEGGLTHSSEGDVEENRGEGVVTKTFHDKGSECGNTTACDTTILSASFDFDAAGI